MPRINNLAYANLHIQGAQRREWLRHHSPAHLEHCYDLVMRGWQQRAPGTSLSTLVLGAGACTEVPLVDLARISDEVVLADLDNAAMRRAGSEITTVDLRKRIQLLPCDISGDVSTKLQRLLDRQDWSSLVRQGAETVFTVAAQCLDDCTVPDPPEIGSLIPGEFGLVLSSLVVSQLFSYPLLDVLDVIQKQAPDMLVEQERHRRYQDAAQAFRTRIIKAHLHLLREMLDRGGVAVLLSDIRGFVFNVYGTDHDATHRRAIPLVPRIFPELVRSEFTVVEEAQWEWLTDLPAQGRPGRGYEVSGYILEMPG